MAREVAESARNNYNYGQLIKSSLLAIFNERCLKERLLPKYTWVENFNIPTNREISIILIHLTDNIILPT